MHIQAMPNSLSLSLSLSTCSALAVGACVKMCMMQVCVNEARDVILHVLLVADRVSELLSLVYGIHCIRKTKLAGMCARNAQAKDVMMR
jgi:hypothetical protein